MSDESTVCVICQKEEKDHKKFIECIYCHKAEHFKCKNVIGSAVRKLREQPYFCSLECHEFYLRTTRSSTESQVLNDIQVLLSEVRETKSEMKAVKNTVGEMEKFQNFLSGQLDTLLCEVKSIKIEHTELKANVDSLENNHRLVSAKVSKLELEVDRINRTTLTKNAIILGVPVTKNEMLPQLVGKFAASVGYELPNSAVVDAKRLISKESNGRTKQTQPIKVTFSEEQFKEQLFYRKKNHGQLLVSALDPSFTGIVNKVVLRDELTSHGMSLLKEAKEVLLQADWKFIWPGRNGAILAKKTENSKIELIRCLADLKLLENANKKRLLDSSMLHSTAISSPSPKRRQ